MNPSAIHPGEPRTDADAIIEVARQGVVSGADANFPGLLFTRGVTQFDAEAYMERPRRIESTETFTTAESFAAYVDRFDEGATFVKARRNDAEIMATFDYHQPGVPAHASHNAVLAVAASPEWDAWCRHDKSLMGQAAFAEFLTENRGVIVEPDAATMLELAQSFQATAETDFKSRVSLETGAVTFLLDHRVEGSGVVKGQPIKAPTRMRLRMPIIDGSALVDVTVLLRWRTTPALQLGFHIDQREALWRTAFDQLITDVEMAIEPIVYR